MPQRLVAKPLTWLDRAAILGAVGLFHAGVLGAGVVSSAQTPPVVALHEVEIVAAEALGLDSPKPQPVAVPTALPAPAGPQAAKPEAQGKPESPEPEVPNPVAGQDRALDVTDMPQEPDDREDATSAQEGAPQPAQAAAADTPAPPSREVLIEYAVLVSQAINRLKYYPETARDDRNTGVVEVSFRLDAAGAVILAEVAKSSGSAALDAAALQMIRAADLPPPPNGPFKGRIAIDFRIRQ